MRKHPNHATLYATIKDGATAYVSAGRGADADHGEVIDMDDDCIEVAWGSLVRTWINVDAVTIHATLDEAIAAADAARGQE